MQQQQQRREKCSKEIYMQGAIPAHYAAIMQLN